QYVIADGRTTLLNALGLAGDLTVFGKRDDVLLVRNVDGVISKHRVDLTNADFINSPFYELKQGDVVYVTPNRTQERISKRDPNLGAYISAVSVLVAIVTLLIRR
ncbi:MAG: polysaccharide export protein, partial [Cruoricaptor ignavus]|nr:polysaccharide export protein [Cruoricaptor ignavus]